MLAYLLSVTKDIDEDVYGHTTEDLMDQPGYLKEEVMLMLGWDSKPWSPLRDASSTQEGSRKILQNLVRKGLRLADLAPLFRSVPAVAPGLPLPIGLFFLRIKS